MLIRGLSILWQTHQQHHHMHVNMQGGLDVYVTDAHILVGTVAL